jgi:hypothetical protein
MHRAGRILMPQRNQLTEEQLAELGALVGTADSIELKLTVPESARRSTIAALGLDPLQGQIRQVFFFDTPDLALDRAGVVVRARRIQGPKHDTVVKLRPVVPTELPHHLRSRPECKVEVDVVPGAFVCSASLKGEIGPRAVQKALAGSRTVGSLFSKEQRAFFAAHAPEGISMDDLSVLGPIFVLKVKTYPETFSRRLVAELWLYPGGQALLELSTTCKPGEGWAALEDARALLSSIGLEPGGQQQTKTKAALRFFSKELQAAAAAPAPAEAPPAQAPVEADAQA